MTRLSIKRLDPSATLPKRHSEHDAGIDIYTNETYVLKAGETHAFSTGVAAEFEPGYVVLIWDRSSMGAKGVHAFGGVIDAGYRGEWKILLHNGTAGSIEIHKGDRIAQALLQRFEPADIGEVTELGSTGRGDKGFGSSGR